MTVEGGRPHTSSTTGRALDDSQRILADLDSRRKGALVGPYSPVLGFMRHAGDEFLALLHDRNLSPDLTKHEGITLGLCVRSLTTFYAIVDMLELSLSLQALAIHRSLFDLMLQTRWIQQDPEPRCARYIDYDTLHRWYYLRYISRWGDIKDAALRTELVIKLAALCRRYGVIDEDVTDDAFAEDIDTLTNKLRNQEFRGGATGTWHGKSTADLVADVGQDFPAGNRFSNGVDYLEYLYRVVFGLSSAQLHPTPRVTGEVFIPTPEGLKIQIGPDPKWTVQVASTAFPFMNWTFEVLDELVDLSMSSKLEGLLAEHREAMAAAPRDTAAEN